MQAPETAFDALWDAIAHHRDDVESTEHTCRWEVCVQGGDGVALIVTFPMPSEMPLAYSAIMLLSPQRRYFVVESTSEQIIRKHRRTFSWIEPASPVATDPRRSLGWLCEWMADGSRRNYQMVDYDSIADVMQNVNTWIGRAGPWMPSADPAGVMASLDLASLPCRTMDGPMDRALTGMFDSYVGSISTSLPTTMTGYHERAMAIRKFIEEAVNSYGSSYTEITIHTLTAIELLLVARATAEASALTVMWQNFCHRYRGNLAPETMLANAAAALATALDADVVDQRPSIEYWMRFRDTFKPKMQRHLAGADHPLLLATTDDFVRRAAVLWSMATDHP